MRSERGPAHLALLVSLAPSAEPAKGTLALVVRDRATGKPIPCRVHLKDAAEKAYKPDKLPFWHDHFVCGGSVELELVPGSYRIEIERGPEFARVSNKIEIAAKDTTRAEVELDRLVDMAAEGWWPGDLHVHRPVEDIELLMQAEDLHIAPVITWWNKRVPYHTLIAVLPN